MAATESTAQATEATAESANPSDATESANAAS
jgi:hypothetical protein